MSQAEIDALEADFTEQITKSWDYFKRVDYATRLDDVLVGAIVTSMLDRGQVLIDFTSQRAGLGAVAVQTGSNHYLRFEHPADKSRTTVALTHLTPSATEGEVLGHHASVVIGWGQRVANPSEVINALKQELKSNLIQTPEPGTVTVDGDLTSGYAYTQIDLIWSIDDYVQRDYTTDHAKVARSLHAAVHSLRKYWYGRFNPAQG